MTLIHNILMVGIFLIVTVAIIVLTSYRDNLVPVKYDCALLIGSWHPDFPPEAIEACRKKGIPYDNSKTSYR
jgi:hypothetical protein